MFKKIVIRVDANHKIGLGHLMRCIALSQNFIKKNVEVTIIARCLSALVKERIISEGIKLDCIADELGLYEDLYKTISLMEYHNVNWIILDGYSFNSEYQYNLKKRGYNVCVIDDNRDFNCYYADIILNQNLYAKKLDYQSVSLCNVKLLLGQKYLLIRDDFISSRPKTRLIKDEVNEILITMGGSDPHNYTKEIIKRIHAISNNKKILCNIVLGAGYRNREELISECRKLNIKYEIYFNLNDNSFSNLMLNSDLAITAAGSTVWELCTTKLPFILVQIEVNQKRFCKEIDHIACETLFIDNMDSWEDKIAFSINNKQERKRCCDYIGNVVDGLGASRLYNEMNKIH